MSEVSDIRKRVDLVAFGTAVSKADCRQMKLRQISKIKEIREALDSEGIRALDDQARALGLCRSTTWTVLQGAHKSSGLSALVLRRMLDSSYVPDSVRVKIQEYIAEKSAGLYGHSRTAIHKFKAKLSVDKAQRRPLRVVSKEL
jgi:hypothetical protein